VEDERSSFTNARWSLANRLGTASTSVLERRLFVRWGGLKGAVPIFLGTFVLLQGIDEANRIYEIIVVVTFSVIVQATSIPLAAAKLVVPMRNAPRSDRSMRSALIHHDPGTQVVPFDIRDRPSSRGFGA
jgi:NhaP-type Na+/H+ and K+/H+ antiporter